MCTYAYTVVKPAMNEYLHMLLWCETIVYVLMTPCCYDY